MDKYEEFINWLAQSAKRCKDFGLFPSVCIAQGILESAWGQSKIGEYNLFGRKAVPGDKSITVTTQECYDGEWVTINDEFKDYDSLDEAIEDYCILLTEEPVYVNSIDYSSLENFVRTMAEIYATDPEYADKLLSTISANDLTQYD